MSIKSKFELTAIYVTAVMLVASLISLGVRASEAGSIEERYPSLYAENIVEMTVPEQKTVYLTFDDGPSRNTEKILDILKEENVKATFFVCAQCAESVDVPALLQRILAEGHEIGLHSYMHDYGKVYRSLEDYLEDLNKINDYIFESAGYKSNILRFPGGSKSSNASSELMKRIIAEVTRRGYRYYDWNIDSGDSTTEVNSAGYLSGKIIKNTKDRQQVIVLMHDSPGPKTTPEAVKIAIPALREQRYVFDRLTPSV
uniref:Carbohydrate esterase family 4 protein n=1 Tax=termite gut metagenome TaxID=433724 RepID=S0DFZ7_9ZZZZ